MAVHKELIVLTDMLLMNKIQDGIIVDKDIAENVEEKTRSVGGTLTVKNNTDFLSAEEVALLKRTMLKTFPADEQESFIRTCQRTRLDPFVKQIHATRRYQKVRDDSGETKKVPTLVTVTGIMGLCAVADRTGNYDGCEIFWCGPDGVWKSEWVSDEFPAAAKCIVYHKQRTKPEVAIARWASYVGQTYNYQTKQWEVSDFWARMPDYMLGKVSKAAALRGAFPDQTSGVYIHEELDSNITETEEVSADEEKIAYNQRREAELKAEVASGAVPGVKWVEQKTGHRPAPEEALEPGLPQDQIPEKPKKVPSPVPPKAAPAPSPVASPATVAEQKREPAFGQQLKEDYSQQPVPASDELDMTPAPPPAEPPWKSHVILGLRHAKFHKRKIGELNQAELAIIENQWLPKIREQWDAASDEQRLDAERFEAAIAFYKMAKPWEER
jgi:phage recombination protein Bet